MLNDAITDLAAETRKGGDFETLLGEIASDYGLNPVALRKGFDTKYPNGLPDLADVADLNAKLVEKKIKAACDFYGVPAPHGIYIVDGEKFAVICRDRRATVWCHAVRLSDGHRFRIRMSAMKKAA